MNNSPLSLQLPSVRLPRPLVRVRRSLRAKLLPLVLLFAGVRSIAQSLNPTPEDLTQQVEQLTSSVSQQQEQLHQSLLQITILQQQVAALQAQLVSRSKSEEQSTLPDDPTGAATALARQVQGLREQQEVQGAELATHEQTKVETESKFPLTLTGLILANAFHNSGGVDVIQSPTLAATGASTTGISLRQTVLGLDARGPHLFAASTHADVRVDFFGNASPSSPGSYGGYSAGLLRLRTAHATADWAHAHAFVMLDRPVLSPDTPTSLTSVAQPALAWSGNLWNWLPQVGGAYQRALGSASSLLLEAALMDVPDPPAFSNPSNSASFSEQSGWPGSEVHLAYMHGDPSSGFRLGAGGYFSPHAASGVFHYDAWAATLDYRLPLSHHLEATGAFYRGLALGGLGGGAYKDFIYTVSTSGAYQFERPLDAAGGWSQITARLGQHFEANTAFGLDDAFASELRPYATATGGTYANLIRNGTFFSNLIYSPNAYTVFSFEYRKIDSTPVTGVATAADVYGVAVGYKF